MQRTHTSPLRKVDVPILLSPPTLTGNEISQFQKMLASGWIAPVGPVVSTFESALARATTFPYVAALSSGTMALQIAYRLANLAPGDEVWTSTLTYIATVAPAVQMGAVPVFLDVDPQSWTLDAGLLADALAQADRKGRLPRLVVSVDLYGQCANLPKIVKVCDRWGVRVISDSAEGMGAMAYGRQAGRGAWLAAFSFNGNKIITCGGGGALAADEPHLIAQAHFLARQARESAPHYQHEMLGYNACIPAPCAAVGLAQLPSLATRVARRRHVFAMYEAALSDLPGISFMPEPDWSHSSRWLSVMLVDAEKSGISCVEICHALTAAGVESRPVWKPMHMQPVFSKARVIGGTIAERLFRDGLCLPSGTGLQPEEQMHVISTIRKLMAR